MDMIKMLLEYGANNVSQTYISGYVPLEIAVEQANVDMIVLLVNAGANVNHNRGS